MSHHKTTGPWLIIAHKPAYLFYSVSEDFERLVNQRKGYIIYRTKKQGLCTKVQCIYTKSNSIYFEPGLISKIKH